MHVCISAAGQRFLWASQTISAEFTQNVLTLADLTERTGSRILLLPYVPTVTADCLPGGDAHYRCSVHILKTRIGAQGLLPIVSIVLLDWLWEPGNVLNGV